MDFQFRLRQLRQQHDTVKLQFVNVELDLAITYCLMAVETMDRGKSYRNIANADRAYSAAVYFLEGNPIASQNFETKEKLARFHSLRTSFDSVANVGQDSFRMSRGQSANQTSGY